MTSKQRTALGETLRQLANLVASALVLSQVVAQQSPSWMAVVAGVTAWMALVWFALAMIGGK